MMTTGKTIQAKQLAYGLAVFILCIIVCSFDAQAANSASEKNIQFRSYIQVDQQLGGMAVEKITIPETGKPPAAWSGTSTMFICQYGVASAWRRLMAGVGLIFMERKCSTGLTGRMTGVDGE
jgi:hypothetical protein